MVEWRTDEMVVLRESVVAEELGSLVEAHPCQASEGLTFLAVAQGLLID